MRGTLFVALAGILSLAACAAGETPPDQLKLIQSILDKNAAAIAKIKSIRLVQDYERHMKSYPYEQPGDPPEGDQVMASHLNYVARGDCFRAQRTRVTTVPTANYRREIFDQAVLRYDCSIQVSKTPKNDLVHVIQHTSIASMDDAVRRGVNAARAHYAHSFISAKHFDLPELLSRSDLAWNVDHQTNEGDLYVLTWRSKSGLVASYRFDAAKDYLLTSITSWDPQGKVIYELHSDIEKMNGVWFPTHIKRAEYGEDPRTEEVWVRSVELNPTLDDSEFTLEKLDINYDDVLLHRKEQHYLAKPEQFKFKDGAWMPYVPKPMTLKRLDP